MANSSHLFIGVDLGSQGVRLVVVTETGQVVTWRSMPFETQDVVSRDGMHEQNPLAWWSTFCNTTQGLLDELAAKGYPASSLQGISVDGTSGTLVALDAVGDPVRPAIMYNDARAVDEAEQINTLPDADRFCRKLGYRFAASFALSKIVWFLQHEPELFGRTAHLAHQADYITGHLTGDFAISDYSNALKTGYDLVAERWPNWLDNWPGVLTRLPHIEAPGTLIGHLTRLAATQTGLPEGLPVISGASDGTAGFIASGARQPGDYNTTLGTTLVFKGISEQLCSHPKGIIYCHKLPGGLWLPGAASNTGGEWVMKYFARDSLRELDETAANQLPSNHIAYPLVRDGERFPFLSSGAREFCVPEPADKQGRFTAYLQGVALVERLSYRTLDAIAGTSDGDIYSTGGGSRSNTWMQCRADVTGRRVHRPACPESAFGSAILAAVGTHSHNLWTSIEQMVHIEATFTPNADLLDEYNKIFNDFRGELQRRNML